MEKTATDPSRLAIRMDSVQWKNGYPKSPAYQPSPSRDDQDKNPGAVSNPSNHHILMKNVECLRAADGTVVITSRRSNIKIDKLTTYVLAASELLATN